MVKHNITYFGGCNSQGLKTKLTAAFDKTSQKHMDICSVNQKVLLDNMIFVVKIMKQTGRFHNHYPPLNMVDKLHRRCYLMRNSGGLYSLTQKNRVVPLHLKVCKKMYATLNTG